MLVTVVLLKSDPELFNSKAGVGGKSSKSKWHS